MLDRRFLNLNIVVNGFHSSFANPVAGTQYIVKYDSYNPERTEDFSNYIARYDGSNWTFTKPRAGETEVLNIETGEILRFNGTAWVAVTDLYKTRFTVVEDFIQGIYDKSDVEAIENTGIYGRQYILKLKNEDDLYYYSLSIDSFNYETLFNASKYFNLKTKKIATFEIDGQNSSYTETTPEADDVIYNKADSHFYYFDSTAGTFIKIGGDNFVQPVNDILDFATAFGKEPDTVKVAGKKILFPAEDKVATITADNLENNAYYDEAVIGTKIVDDKVIMPAYIVLNDPSDEGPKLYVREKDKEYKYLCYDVPANAIFLNKADNLLYVYDKASNSFVKTGSNLKPYVEVHTLTEDEAAAKSFNLTNSIAAGQEDNILLFVDGVAQAVGVDFSVADNNKITWSDKGLAAIGMVKGDIFIIHYLRG